MLCFHTGGTISGWRDVMYRRWLVVFVAIMMTVLPGPSIARAQQKSAAPTTLAVEVVDDEMPALQAPVLGTPEGGFLETSRFRRLSDGKQKAGSATVARLRVRALMEGEAVRIKVFAVFDDSEPVDVPGPKYGTREQYVAGYLIYEGETVNVRELTSFGIEPLLLRVVRVQLQVEEQPLAANAEIENTLKSVEVVSFTPVPASSWYRLSLRNLTRKSIIALEIYESEQGRRGSGSQMSMQSTPGRPVIAPGAVYETQVSVSGSRVRMTPQGFVPDPPPSLTFVIGTLVFDDGTYEGEAEVAANIEARQLGQRLQIKRVLSLLGEITDAQEQDAIALEKLKTQASALRIDVDAATVNELLTRYPSLSEEYQKKRLMAEIMNGFRNGREEVLHRIVEFEQAAGRVGFNTWLSRIKEQYEAMTSGY